MLFEGLPSFEYVFVRLVLLLLLLLPSGIDRDLMERSGGRDEEALLADERGGEEGR